MAFKKGNKTKSQFKKGHTVSLEVRKKISECNSGRIFSEEHKMKLSLAKKGKSYEEIMGVEKALEKKQKLRVCGLSRKHTEESKKKMSLIQKQILRKWNGLHTQGEFKKGHIVTEETRKKISQTHKKRGISLEGRKKLSIEMKKRRATIIIPIKDSSIELKIQNYLKELKIHFFTHQYMSQINHSYQCDIFIPSLNLVIECDGDYWHDYPTGKEIDHIRTSELLEKGFKVLRLWGRDIKTLTVKKFGEKLEKIN